MIATLVQALGLAALLGVGASLLSAIHRVLLDRSTGPGPREARAGGLRFSAAVGALGLAALVPLSPQTAAVRMGLAEPAILVFGLLIALSGETEDGPARPGAALALTLAAAAARAPLQAGDFVELVAIQSTTLPNWSFFATPFSVIAFLIYLSAVELLAPASTRTASSVPRAALVLVGTTIFLGGWQMPGIALADLANNATLALVLGVVVVLAKALLLGAIQGIFTLGAAPHAGFRTRLVWGALVPGALLVALVNAAWRTLASAEIDLAGKSAALALLVLMLVTLLRLFHLKKEKPETGKTPAGEGTAHRHDRVRRYRVKKRRPRPAPLPGIASWRQLGREIGEHVTSSLQRLRRRHLSEPAEGPKA